MRRWLAELYRRDPVLAVCGWLMVALAAAMLVGLGVDDRQVLGINVWLKPLKFAISIAIYVWTLAWLLAYVPGPRSAKQLIRWGTAVAMVVEIVCIAGQSARGVASHFNAAQPFDGIIFSTMGLFILFNTALDLLLLALFMRPNAVQRPGYLLGIRCGLVGTLFASVIGGVMIAHGAHTVGAPDGGPGLWLVNWSTDAGDLRIAHALGLHALQILPLVGFLTDRAGSQTRSVVLTAAAAIIYLGLTAGLFVAALGSRPLVLT